MPIVQGGVRFHRAVPGVGNISTKKRLKELVKDSPELLQFYTTSELGEQFAGPVDKLGEETTLLVVGPDPYTNRVWYASINRGPRGHLRVT